MIDAEKREKVIRGLKACGCSAGVLKICEVMECPYRVNHGACVHLLAHDALALLKEQEPRVMTLKELKSMETWNKNTPPYLWVEDITGRNNRWNYWRAIRVALNLPGTMGVQNYGSVWRVWNLQPTSEQMLDTPWEVTENG